MSEATALIGQLKDHVTKPEDKITISIYREDMDRINQIIRFLNFQGKVDLTKPEAVSIILTQFENIFPQSVK